jgi:hypothetical protein
MAFDGKAFGKEMSEIVKGYVDREINQASSNITSVLKAYIDARLAGDTKAEIKPVVRVRAGRKGA